MCSYKQSSYPTVVGVIMEIIEITCDIQILHPSKLTGSLCHSSGACLLPRRKAETTIIRERATTLLPIEVYVYFTMDIILLLNVASEPVSTVHKVLQWYLCFA